MNHRPADPPIVVHRVHTDPRIGNCIDNCIEEDVR